MGANGSTAVMTKQKLIKQNGKSDYHLPNDSLENLQTYYSLITF